MADVEGARSFQATGLAYDTFMGRYSRRLAAPFADAAGVVPGVTALDVGCGPGALTAVLVERLGAAAVAATDPSAPFVSDCRDRHPGVEVRQGQAERIPFEDNAFDVVLAQLVLHFVSDAEQAAAEFRRVLRPGGTAAACVWDFAEGMQMLRLFWDAALALDPDAPDEATTLRFGGDGEIADLLAAAGFVDVAECTLRVSSPYADFDELWHGFCRGIGPAGSYCLGRSDDQRAALRDELFARLGSPSGPFSLTALARSASGRSPG